MNCGHSIAYSWLQNQFPALESILADYKGNLSLPPSHIPSLSSVIASLLLNPLYYSHVSAFNPLCPVLQSLFCGGAFCVEPFLRPLLRALSAPTRLHPPCHTVCFVRHISRADLWRPHQRGHIQGSRRPADIFPIWPLALAPWGARLSFYRPLKVYIAEEVWLGDFTHKFLLKQFEGEFKHISSFVKSLATLTCSSPV